MSLQLSKKSILKKTAQVSVLTLASRILGIIREFLIVRYFGVGAVSDAFMTAFRIPNFFRQVFAEGALSASFVPVMVGAAKKGNRRDANGLMSLSFIFFEGIILAMYAFVLFKTSFVIRLLAPGFSQEQITYAIPFLQIMFSFLFFISSTALFGGALHAVNHFFIPALGTPLWNIVYIGALIFCLAYKMPPVYLCIGIIAGAGLQFLVHLIAFFYYGYSFGAITQGARALFKTVLSKFLPCLFGVSIFELNLFISSSIASFLPKGDPTLLNYGARFFNIPLGMFAVALSSILLPHFSRLVLYAPRRLNFYVLEVAKFVAWIILPATLFLMYLSHPLFDLLLSGRATPAQITNGGEILICYAVGLIFLCLNKILLSIFYAFGDTWATTTASAICAGINIVADLVGMYFYGARGIAIANSISGIAMTIACFVLLAKRHKVNFYGIRFAKFFARYLVQFIPAAVIFYVLHREIISFCINSKLYWFATGAGFWVISCGLAGVGMVGLFLTRKTFKVDSYFLQQ